MAILWWLILCGLAGWFIICIRREVIDPPCPPVWRCLIGFFLGLPGGLFYRYVVLKKGPYDSIDILVSMIVAALGAYFIYTFFCPNFIRRKPQ